MIINLYQEDGDLINSYDGVVDAYYGLKDVKSFDRRNGIKTNYFFEMEVDENIIPIKIYKRGCFVK